MHCIENHMISSPAWERWCAPATQNFHGMLMSIAVAITSLAEHYHALPYALPPVILVITLSVPQTACRRSFWREDAADSADGQRDRIPRSAGGRLPPPGALTPPFTSM
jgi:hypothetical protein